MQPEHYRFVNEGVASIVFACQEGDLNGRVVRIPKQPYHNPERDDQARQRITAIFSALFGQEYILSEEVILIPCSQLRILVAESRPKRSPTRISLFDVDQIPETGSWPGWIMDDMTRINAAPSLLTVELKPKWGFLLSPGEYKTDPVQTRICRNCIYQNLKQDQGRVESISRYCPLDLFHSDPGRRRRALMQLIETPQNNLVVFNGDGVVLSDETSRPLANADLIELVGAVLSRHLDLIGRIQRSQRLTMLTLGQVDDMLEGMDPDLWLDLVNDPLSQDITDRIISDPIYRRDAAPHDYPDCLREPRRYASSAVPGVPARDAPVPVDDPVTMLRLLLLEMTARDVSLMMTFTPVDEQHDHGSPSDRPGAPPIRSIESGGRRWRYKIAVVDLETKYPKKIRHWIEVEGDMLAHFAKRCQGSTGTV